MKIFNLLHVLSIGFPFVVTSEHSQDVLGPAKQPSSRPNVVFILSDDQDLHMESLSYMPRLQQYLIREGTFYKRHFCTIALCCPSRVSLWTGKAAHNTNVTDVNPPYGGYPKFVSQGLNDAYLPVWLQEAGYNTYYTGKLFNSHTVENYNDPYPAGFNGSDFLLDPHTYEYLNASFQRDQSPPVSYEGQYSTDVLASKAFGFLDDAVKDSRPFFLTIAPVAPHSNVKFGRSLSNRSMEVAEIELSPPIPAERHRHLFKSAIVPRNANFNPEEPSSVNWIRSLPRQNQSNIDFNDHFYRSRLRALQAVDEIVDDVVTRLSDYGILDNTYVIYTTDNGYHIGQHRLQPGKECGFEEDINIPLVIRGPNVPRNAVTDIVTSHTDLVPTIFELIGKPARSDFDGAAIPTTKNGLQRAEEGDRHEHVNVEYWGFALTEGKYGKEFYWNNTYKALRIIGDGYNLYYSVWCNNEHELYDLTPWAILHPSTPSTNNPNRDTHTDSGRGGGGGAVNNLWDALDAKYDRFYGEEQRRVAFSRCEQGYIIESEGPQDVKAYVERGGLGWSEFV
ncbi:MAG: hypothetical protein Q9160_007172 [Pyrenula sp. 1 TL-2023]